MTVSKILAETEKNGKTVSAYESYDKYSVVPYYDIVVSDGCIALYVIKTAKTTWRKKFKEIVEEI